MQTSFYTALDMQRLIAEELEWRCRIWQDGVKLPLICLTRLPSLAACNVASVRPSLAC